MVRGEGFDGKDFRFNDLELVTDKREYAPGDKVKLLVNTNQQRRRRAAVRPADQRRLSAAASCCACKGKSIEEEIAVVQQRHAQLLHRGRHHRRWPGALGDARGGRAAGKARAQRRGAAVADGVQAGPEGDREGQADRLRRQAVRRLDGASACTTRASSTSPAARNVPEIKEFFWKWRRHHHPQHRIEPGPLLRQPAAPHGDRHDQPRRLRRPGGRGNRTPTAGWRCGDAAGHAGGDGLRRQAANGADGCEDASDAKATDSAKDGQPRTTSLAEDESGRRAGGREPPPGVEPTVRKNFADTAFWAASLTTDKDGIAEVNFDHARAT